MKKILITGGSGFIGTELTKTLLEKGHEVAIADIKESSIEGTSYIFCDILDSYQVEDAVQGKDLVYHLAANPNPSLADKNPRWDLSVNVNGTLNVAQACRKYKTRMVFSSSAAVIYSPLSCYAISKNTAEKYILHKVSKKGLNASIVRFWNIYGPTQKLGFVIPDFFEKFLEYSEKMVIKGDGSDLRDYVYIDDAIEALQLVAEKGQPGIIYEIGTGRQISTYELALLIQKILGANKPIETSKPRKEDVKKFYQDLEPISKLGWIPKYSLEDGLKKIGVGKW